jgi:hypothetical protein
LNLLGNDRDPDGDRLFITAINGISVRPGVPITLPSGATLVVNADGTVTYTPNPSFSGVDTFSYTVSDGTDAVTAAATVEVERAPEVNQSGQVPDNLLTAHLMPGFGIDPLIPDTRQPLPPAPFLGQRFVVAAVQDARSLNSVNGLPGAAAPGVLDEVRRLTEQRPYAERIREHLDQGMNWWDVEGLRHSLEVANNGNASGQPGVMVHSYVAGRTLTVALEYLPHGSGSVPASYRATLANGGPLPAWLAFDPATGVMIGTPPAGTEKITLKVQAALQDGRTVSGSVTVEADTGRLILHGSGQPHAQREPIGVPLFSAQLAEHGDRFNLEVERLRAALRVNG